MAQASVSGFFLPQRFLNQEKDNKIRTQKVLN